LLVEAVANPSFGKNWQKVLDDLQLNKHAFLNLEMSQYGRLNDVYKNTVKKLMAAAEYKEAKVVNLSKLD
jgi:hypothetical protein